MTSKKDVVAFGEKAGYISTERQRNVQPVTIGNGVWAALGCDPGRGDRGELGHRDGCCRDEKCLANCLAVGVPVKAIKNLDLKGDLQ